MIFRKFLHAGIWLLFLCMITHSTYTFAQWASTTTDPVSPALSNVGTLIGSDGSWNSSSSTKDKVFDNNINTCFDATTGNGNWVGRDLGVIYTIDHISFIPRLYNESRVVGGKFQTSTDAAFSNPVTIYTVPSSAAVFSYSHILNTSTTATTTARYIRYLSPDNGFCNIAEVKLYGTIVPTTPSSPNAITSWTGNTYDGGFKLVGASNSNLGLSVDANGQVIADSNIICKTMYAKSFKGIYRVVPDYVFDNDYLLMPLNKLEQYIKQNKHLPDIPSDADYKRRGVVDLQEINLLLLRKIEELTLHLISLDKKTKKLQTQLSAN